MKEASRYFVIVSFLSLSPVHNAFADDVYSIEMQALAPDVYLLHRPDPLREPVEPNALFIVNDNDVVVFEGGGAPLVAERSIALIRSVTDKPVSHVINSHWHGDHNLGNQVYRAEFPDLKIVAHPETHAAMTGSPMGYVERYVPMLTGLIDEWSAEQEKGELAPRRAELLPSLALMRDELARTTITPPDLLIDDRLVLERGNREIHIIHPGRGNTPGDLVMWLPEERIPNLALHGMFLAVQLVVEQGQFGVYRRTRGPGSGDPQRDSLRRHDVVDSLFQVALGKALHHSGFDPRFVVSASDLLLSR